MDRFRKAMILKNYERNRMLEKATVEMFPVYRVPAVKRRLKKKLRRK
jgi:hypothetical protein